MAQEGLAEDPVEFSPVRYGPMARLMSDEDFLF
jgi:hypothetical protein